MGQRFFWVNHKQTFKREVTENYIWSPKREVNGAYNQSYENLTYVQSGDLIFSFANASIQAIGTAVSECYEAIKPGGFAENWSDVGWRVDVKFDKLKNGFRPKGCINEFKHLLPLKYSPMNEIGNGNQKCYLAEISAELAYYLYSKIDKSDRQNTIFDQDNLLEFLDNTVKEAIVLQRIGQNIFRKNLLEIYKNTCALTTIQLPILLRASHIKPWSKSNAKERLDTANGILLAAHVDVLFDKGFISFDDNGNVLLADDSISQIFNEHKIPLFLKLLPADSIKYLKWHRENVFRKKLL